jgi:hypothetical protein
LRQAKGLPQVAQVFCGKSDFLRIFIVAKLALAGKTSMLPMLWIP